MFSVKEILKSKGSHYWSISPKATAYEALQLMADKDIGAILVMEHDKVVGIFSERDYARKVILRGKSSKETTVGELMSSPVVVVSQDDTLDYCMALMTVNKHRHLPVLDNDRVAGRKRLAPVAGDDLPEIDDGDFHRLPISSCQFAFRPISSAS